MKAKQNYHQMMYISVISRCNERSSYIGTVDIVWRIFNEGFYYMGPYAYDEVASVYSMIALAPNFNVDFVFLPSYAHLFFIPFQFFRRPLLTPILRYKLAVDHCDAHILLHFHDFRWQRKHFYPYKERGIPTTSKHHAFIFINKILPHINSHSLFTLPFDTVVGLTIKNGDRWKPYEKILWAHVPKHSQTRGQWSDCGSFSTLPLLPPPG